MENKGLNIFNSKYVLCDEASATDAAIQGVSRVVAHECVAARSHRAVQRPRVMQAAGTCTIGPATG
jgi:hypothetical protein